MIFFLILRYTKWDVKFKTGGTFLELDILNVDFKKGIKK